MNLFEYLLKRLQQQRVSWLRLLGWWLRAQQLLLQFRSLVRRLPARWRAVLTTCVYGLGAGASAVAFQLGMNWFYQLSLVRLSHQSRATFFVGSFVLLIGSSLIVGWLLNSFCREAAGSGIPQLKLAFWKDFGFVPWRVVWVKFVAGILSIGGGSSLGREGPIVQPAGAVGSNLAALAGESKQSRRAPTAAGAAAGLAAFNTPLAATTFVLEEIIGDLNSRFLGAVFVPTNSHSQPSARGAGSNLNLDTPLCFWRELDTQTNWIGLSNTGNGNVGRTALWRSAGPDSGISVPTFSTKRS
jgi:hypothetical protein